MTHNELFKRLRKAGCFIVRHGGRHDLWFSPVTGKQKPVPRHGTKEIPIGLLKNLEKELLGL
jgi:predicted RNA binding protein YcfA (HicA-like mRNA interferase family)